jgi:formylglycine-generating enzyme required for sulfatase activity/pimeloyl-ACP methyl ester carboxylesterase
MTARKIALVTLLSLGLPLMALGLPLAAAAQASPAESSEELAAFPAARVSLRRAGSVPGTEGGTLDQEIVLNGFAIARTELTQASFERVMGRNPSQRKGANLPVTNVSWRDALEYCNRRSEQEGLAPCYDLDTFQCDFRKSGYRLPTESEWLYAAQSSTIPADHPEQANLGSRNTKSIGQLRADLNELAVQPVASYAPNARGLHDLLGNVWEWTYDYFNTQTALLTATEFPSGPTRGFERVILGGSCRSGFWGRRNESIAARDFRRGFAETERSPYTGFRVCRTIPNPNYLALAKGKVEEWLAQFDQAPEAYRGSLGELTALATAGESTAQWQKRAAELRQKWGRILGRPANLAPQKPQTRLLRAVDEGFYTGQVMELRTEPDSWAKIYLMIPAKPVRRPMPVVIVPYYDIDTPAGSNLGGHVFSPSYTRHFGEHLLRRGFAVLAVRWWAQSYGEDYAEAVMNLYERHPDWSGLGKWVWDSQRVLDYLETVDGIDRTRVGMIGHSLGGKMTLYAAAMDRRVAAAVSSEPGIGLRFSNYDDYWYLSEEAVERPREPFDQHELLALIAPRPFLLIGGESADTDKSWHYINAAKAVYKVNGKPEQLGYYNHRQGHSPSPESFELSLEWLDHFLLSRPLAVSAAAHGLP